MNKLVQRAGKPEHQLFITVAGVQGRNQFPYLPANPAGFTEIQSAPYGSRGPVHPGGFRPLIVLSMKRIIDRIPNCTPDRYVFLFSQSFNFKDSLSRIRDEFFSPAYTIFRE